MTKSSSHPPRGAPSGKAPRASWADDPRAIGAGRAKAIVLTLEEGKVLAGKYRLLRRAGFGGMAEPWVAMNEATGAEICVKVFVDVRGDAEPVERFRREAHAAAKLGHRAIVRVFDLVELDADGNVATDGAEVAALAIVMELLRGQTLGDLLTERGKLPPEEAIDIVLPVLSGLGHAHRAGIVHRDIKPDNVFLSLDPDGLVFPKVLDFGVSKNTSPDSAPLTLEGVSLGTPGFMSPEQARGAANVDARSDVFATATLLYVLVTGANPFEDGAFHSVANAILDFHPPRPSELSPSVWAVLERALSKDASARYADALEFAVALRSAAGRPSAPSDPAILVRGRGDAISSSSPVGPTVVTPVSLPRLGSPRRVVATPLVLGVVALLVVIVIVVFLRAGGR